MLTAVIYDSSFGNTARVAKPSGAARPRSAMCASSPSARPLRERRSLTCYWSAAQPSATA